MCAGVPIHVFLFVWFVSQSFVVCLASGEDDHYKSFEEVYGSETVEDHRPSLKQKVTLGHQIPFSPSAQTAKSVHKTVKCTDCDKPRVIYSASKLNVTEQIILDKILDIYIYSCGAKLQDLKVKDSDRAPRVNALLDKIFVKQNISCQNAVEIPYYSSGCFPPVCYFCASKDDLKIEEGAYPHCETCATKNTVPNKRKHNVWKESQTSKKQKRQK